MDRLDPSIAAEGSLSPVSLINRSCGVSTTILDLAVQFSHGSWNKIYSLGEDE